MWMEWGSLVVAALGVVASANLLVNRDTRLMRRLKEQADLVAAMPENSPSKVPLAEHFERRAAAAVRVMERREQPWFQRADAQLPFVLLGIAAYVGALGVSAIGGGAWGDVAFLVLTVGSTCAVLPMAYFMCRGLASGLHGLAARLVARLPS